MNAVAISCGVVIFYPVATERRTKVAVIAHDETDDQFSQAQERFADDLAHNTHTSHSPLNFSIPDFELSFLFSIFHISGSISPSRAIHRPLPLTYLHSKSTPTP